MLAVRVVSRVEWPWHFESEGTRSSAPAVRLELRSGDRVLFVRTVGSGDAEVRYTLHPDEWLNPTKVLALTARCDRQLSGVHVEAWLEARLRR